MRPDDEHGPACEGTAPAVTTDFAESIAAIAALREAGVESVGYRIVSPYDRCYWMRRLRGRTP